ncbi:hypothetical protein LTR64_000249 [Lithohypha guttulata]|uniref:uncharacterized protein n=1 Tax=Lithohypha guttulata TaxID=1690604 RepID=UPI002DE17A41|nr:hypothetical protein LTR51_007611 [Lithohypha guttulata]
MAGLAPIADGYETEDSGYASNFENVSVITESVHSSIYDYRYEHGRRYHAYKQGENDYFMPNDEPEQFRMDLQHHCMFLASGSKLFHAPLQSPVRVLDCGTGTGVWAIAMGEEYPEASIHGIDLSPIQPDWAPSNVKFEIDDVEDDWTWPENHFDLIYSKLMLVGAIKDYRKYFEQAFKHCAPDGYFECLEATAIIRSDHIQITPENPIQKWTTLLNQGVRNLGSSVDIDFEAVAALMREVGFVDVVYQPFKTPIGTWPADPVLKRAGSYQLVAMLEGMESLTLLPFSRGLGMSLEETKKIIEEASREFTRKKGCYYWHT